MVKSRVSKLGSKWSRVCVLVSDKMEEEGGYDLVRMWFERGFYGWLFCVKGVRKERMSRSKTEIK